MPRGRRAKGAVHHKARSAKKGDAAVRRKLHAALLKHKRLKKLVAAKTREFRNKLKKAQAAIYGKAVAAAVKIQEKKHAARHKMLMAAEARFEKKFAKKVAKLAGKKVRGKKGKRGRRTHKKK
ncbi:MAG: hypothetical protein WBE18_06730 [Gammaproteobacteria bacterium]